MCEVMFQLNIPRRCTVFFVHLGVPSLLWFEELHGVSRFGPRLPPGSKTDLEWLRVRHFTPFARLRPVPGGCELTQL